MSYPQDLDEIPTEKLIKELSNRSEDNLNDKCDYCHRQKSTPVCKFPDRHSNRKYIFTNLSIVLNVHKQY